MSQEIFRSVAGKYQDTVAFGVTNDEALVTKLVSDVRETALIWLNDLEPQLYDGEYTMVRTLVHLPLPLLAD